MKLTRFAAALLAPVLGLAVPLAAADAPKPAAAPSPAELVAAAPAADWLLIAPQDLLVMDLAPDSTGRARRVVIQLLPPPFSQGWVGNIRKLVAARWYDGVSVNRVQDNYVVQWGDADGEDAAKAKRLPEALSRIDESDYSIRLGWNCPVGRPVGDNCTVEQLSERAFQKLADPYASSTFWFKGWPLAADFRMTDPAPGVDGTVIDGSLIPERGWPTHCYAMVGVGRDMPPDTGTGAELYTVIGHAPRHLDRNIALVGRVIEGIEHLSSLPRGTGALGFYESAEERVPILSVRMGSEVKGLPAYQYLSTESASFAAYADARANRRDPFFIHPAGGADICNIPVPVRRVKAGG